MLVKMRRKWVGEVEGFVDCYICHVDLEERLDTG